MAETVQDGQEAVDYCCTNPVNVALLDLRMPNMNGVEATRLLTEASGYAALLTSLASFNVLGA